MRVRSIRRAGLAKFRRPLLEMNADKFVQRWEPPIKCRAAIPQTFGSPNTKVTYGPD